MKHKIEVNCPVVFCAEEGTYDQNMVNDAFDALGISPIIKSKCISLFHRVVGYKREADIEEIEMILLYKKGSYPTRAEITKMLKKWFIANHIYLGLDDCEFVKCGEFGK